MSRLIALTLAGMMSGTSAWAIDACGDLANHFGPFDYINPEHRADKNGFNLEIVEKHHFTHKVESLQGGETTTAAGDMGYTLRVWPNHHRALLALSKLAIKQKSERPQGISLPMDCWFDRAKRMSPGDGMVYAIYATYLAKRNRKQEAIENADEAFNLQPESKNVNYNIAVAYMDVKEYDKAMQHAKKAEALGHPLKGVKNRLKELKVWRD